MPTRTCTKCKRNLSVTPKYFHRKKDGKYGFRSVCKDCRKENAQKNKEQRKEYYQKNKEKILIKRTSRKFGIDYNKLFEKQKGVCAICGYKEKAKRNNSEPIKLAVDHNHKTGKVRGLLCGSCNARLGTIERYIEDPEKWNKYLKGDKN